MDIQKELKLWLSDAERIVVAGIGNPIRKDDFVGVKIARGLWEKVSNKVYLIECETVPESYIQPITEFNPSHILLIDAARLGLQPGSVRLFKPEQVNSYPAYSTHALPIRLFCDYLIKTTEAKIALLLIEPENTSFGEGLTRQIEATAQLIINALLKMLPPTKINT